jgi:hypothetical protein
LRKRIASAYQVTAARECKIERRIAFTLTKMMADVRRGMCGCRYQFRRLAVVVMGEKSRRILLSELQRYWHSQQTKALIY